MYEKTGNIAIEYRYRSKPSGLFASRATYFAIELPSKYILIDRENFLKWLKPNHNRFKKVKGGDNKWSELLLIKPEDIPKNDTEIGLISMELKK